MYLYIGRRRFEFMPITTKEFVTGTEIQDLDHLEKWEVGYIAGLLDGEGHIGIHSDYYAQIAISMKHQDTINWLQETTGIGNIYFVKQHDAYRWAVNRTQDAIALLKTVIPFMITRREDAEKLLELLEWRRGK